MKKTFKASFRLLKSIKEGKIKSFTSSLVLAEINWVLAGFYKFSKEQTLESIKSILHLKNLKILDQFNCALACSLYENHNIKFIDALIASNPLIYNKRASVISYDKDFRKLGLSAFKPSEVVKDA